MKLDKIKFAKLIAHCVSNGMSTGDWEIERVEELTEIDVPDPIANKADTAQVDNLLMLINA